MTTPKNPVVAIDGPAGSGKSTVARAVAEALGFPTLDTGAMYRALTWAVLDAGIDPADAPAVIAVAERLDLDVGPPVRVSGRDVNDGWGVAAGRARFSPASGSGGPLASTTLVMLAGRDSLMQSITNRYGL